MVRWSLKAVWRTRFLPIDEGADVGLDRGSAVTVRTIGPRRYSAYGGQIDKVTIQIYPKATDVAQQ